MVESSLWDRSVVHDWKNGKEEKVSRKVRTEPTAESAAHLPVLAPPQLPASQKTLV